MKFSALTVADLASENNHSNIHNPANPANPANPIDLNGNSLANPLLMPAKELLIDSLVDQRNAEISNRLAKFNKTLATKIKEKSNTLAGLAGLAASEKLQPDPTHAQALSILQTLYAEHVARLQEAGFSDKGALVHRHDYWRVLHKAQVTTDAVFDLLDQGRVRTQAEGLYWVPEDAA